MTYFTTRQLAEKAGRAERTIRHHVKQGWLKPEPKSEGIRGHRFSESRASKWLNLHFPGKRL